MSTMQTLPLNKYIKSWTIWGAVGAALAQLAADHSPTGIVTAIGIVITAIGARRAIAKNGQGK